VTDVREAVEHVVDIADSSDANLTKSSGYANILMGMPCRVKNG
jgi:hypothetical protein